MAELTPSTDLQQYFGVRPECWDLCPRIDFTDFQARYGRAGSDLARTAIAGELAQEIQTLHGTNGDPSQCPVEVWESDPRFQLTGDEDSGWAVNGDCAVVIKATLTQQDRSLQQAS
jgi:hypothetical protein